MVFSAACFSIVVILLSEFWLSVGGFWLSITYTISFLYLLLMIGCFKFGMLKHLLVFLGVTWKFHLIMIFAMTGLWLDFVVVRTDAFEPNMFELVLLLTRMNSIWFSYVLFVCVDLCLKKVSDLKIVQHIEFNIFLH